MGKGPNDFCLDADNKCMGALKEYKNDLHLDTKDMGKADTLRYNVIFYVVEENYERAIQELKNFMMQKSEYPKFKPRIERYISYGIDLVNAIQAKRHFPGVSSLTMAKQKEMVDKFHSHFKELKIVLGHVERIQQQLKDEDVRSTVLVVRVCINSAFLITILAFALEAMHGMAANIFIVADDYVARIAEFLFTRF
jgi:hypothetical protein